MPWCPKCRSEYQEGVEACHDCGERLVAGLPSEAEAAKGRGSVLRVRLRALSAAWSRMRREPDWELLAPAPEAKEAAVRGADSLDLSPSPLEAAGNAVARFARRAWPGFRAGLWLLPHSLWRASQLAKLWLLLLLLALVQTGLDFAQYRNIGAARAGDLRYDVDLRRELKSAAYTVYFKWTYLPGLGSTLAEGIERPFHKSFSVLTYPVWLVADKLLRPTDQWTPSHLVYRLVWLWESLLFAVIVALATGGIYGWIVAGIRDDQLTLRGFRQSVLHHFRPLLEWGVILIVLTAASMLVSHIVAQVFTGVTTEELPSHRRSAVGLITLPLALTSFVIVARRTGTFGGIAGGLCVVVARWPTLSVLFLAYRLVYEIARALSEVIRHMVYWPPTNGVGLWCPDLGLPGSISLLGLSLRNWIGLALALLGNMVWAGVGLLLCVAFTLVVMRTGEDIRQGGEESP